MRRRRQRRVRQLDPGSATPARGRLAPNAPPVQPVETEPARSTSAGLEWLNVLGSHERLMRHSRRKSHVVWKDSEEQRSIDARRHRFGCFRRIMSSVTLAVTFGTTCSIMYERLRCG